MHDNLRNKISVESFVKEYGINKIKLNNIFKAVLGNTMYKYYQEKKVESLKVEIMTTSKTITELSYEFSYTDVNHLTKSFVSHYGISPSEMRKSKHKL